MKKKFLLFTFIMIFSTVWGFSQEADEVTTITIKNARQTSYKKAEDTGNDVIYLEGSVELDVQKGSTTSSIKADKITYDRKTEMLYAEGGVEIQTKGSSSGGEKTMAESLLLNTSTLEGVFDGGRVVQTQSDAINLPSGSTLIVFSDLFGKGSENTIAFKNSSLTFCDDENPHWRIDATRTWLLPGGEFAFFNALLYVGALPVLYLPAFYYPKDELVFNPVFSYGKREGYSVQTTTYVYGRKPLGNNSSNSSGSSDSEKNSVASDAIKGLYNFVRPSTLKEQKLEGLVLHNLDNDYSGDTSHYVKILADVYSNIGYMVGVDMNLQPFPSLINKFAFNFDIGISNTVFKLDDNQYYPFSAKGTKYQDESTFLGMTLPFRYSANLDIAFSKPFRISLSMPIYSDPFYAYDYKTNRQETMDWITYLLENVNSKDKKEPTVSEVSSFTWQLSASGSPQLPQFFKPYISSLSLNLNTSVNFSSKNTEEFSYHNSKDFENQWKEFSPGRKFYYPSMLTPVSTTVNLSGTVFTWPPEKKNSNSKKTYTYPITINKPDNLKSEKEIKAEAEEKAKEEELKNENSENEESLKEENSETDNIPESTEDETYKFVLPELTYTPASTNLVDGFNYKLSYSMNANVITQMAYSSTNLKQSEDFKWENIRSSMYTVKTPLNLTSTLSYGGNFFSMVNGIAYSPIYQKHPYISYDLAAGGYKESEANTLILSDYNAESQDISNNNTITLKPFGYLEVFGDTSISWTSNIKLYRRKFIGDVINPEWETLPVDFNDDKCVTTNSLSETLSAKEFGGKMQQKLTFTQILPPLDKQYTAGLSLTFPYVTGTLSYGVQEVKKNKGTEGGEESEWKKNPLQQGLTVTVPLFEKNLNISQSYTYKMEEEEHDSFKLSTSWSGFSLAYVMSNTYGYDFDKGAGWKIRKEKEFLPYSLSFSYTLAKKTYYTWFNRIQISPGLNTSVVADLIRPTNSYFLFTPSLTFKINNFMDVTFSSTSRNSVLYWYFHNEPGDLYSDWGGFPGNIINDLLDSYNFGDQKVREGSGFKLKSLNMTISHDLHDWKFNFSLKIEPRLITENGRKSYDFSPYMSLGVVWNPMESMKTTIIDDYGEWKLE